MTGTPSPTDPDSQRPQTESGVEPTATGQDQPTTPPVPTPAAPEPAPSPTPTSLDPTPTPTPTAPEPTPQADHDAGGGGEVDADNEPERLMIRLIDPRRRADLEGDFGSDLEILRELSDGALLVALVAAGRVDELAAHPAVSALIADEADPPTG